MKIKGVYYLCVDSHVGNSNASKLNGINESIVVVSCVAPSKKQDIFTADLFACELVLMPVATCTHLFQIIFWYVGPSLSM